VGLVERTGARLTRGYGFRDVAHRRPATSRTVYGLASITKSFTALAVLRLQELGALRVHDRVTRHLPEFRTPDPRQTAKITLHHLLTHSSGLPPLPSLFYLWSRSERLDPTYDPRVAQRYGIDAGRPPIDSYEQLLEFLGSEPYRLTGPPGRYVSYSNEGYCLLGAIIERASGRTYESFVEEEILRPAGMGSTTFDPGILIRFPEVTTLYSTDWQREGGRPVASQDWTEDGCARPTGGLRSNVEDMLRYAEIFLRQGRVGRERIVSSESLSAMLYPHVEPSPGNFYGYGIAVLPDYHGKLLAWHTGAKKGVASAFAVVPSAGVGGVVLTNRIGAPADQALEATVNSALGLKPDTPFSPVPEPAAVIPSLTEYGGWYCSGESNWYKISPKRSTLHVEDRGLPPRSSGFNLRPAGNDNFVTEGTGRPMWVGFLRDRRRRIVGMSMWFRFVRKRNPLTLAAARRGRMVW
jgi:CubicO group peptidase (beta-lactamase class C family)